MTDRVFEGHIGKLDPIQEARARIQGKPSYNDAAEALIRQEEAVREVTRKIREKMSPPGTFKIPEILEKRRWEHSIPDGAFRLQPLYDWCFVYQLARYDMEDNERWGETSIIKTQNARNVAENESPRGILISAGLGCLDTLSSHGLFLGDCVFMVRNAPWAIEIDVIGNKKLHIRALRDADLIAGEDLWKRLQSGELVQKQRLVKNDQGHEAIQHYYETRDGKPLNPITPAIPDDL